MAVIVAETATTLATANGFYRAEAYQVDGSSISNSLSSAKTVAVTFANAGNCRGVILGLGTSSVSTKPTRDVTVVLQENTGSWVTRATATRTAAQIHNDITNTRAGMWYKPFLFASPYAVDTTAGKWRFSVSQGAGSGTWYISYNTGNTSMMYVTWCDTAVSFSSGDVPVCAAPVIIDTTTTLGNVALTTISGAVYTLAAMVCSSDTPAYADNAMLKWENPPAASYTLTLDGLVILPSHAGFHIGREGLRIPTAQSANIITLYAPTGGTVRYSGLGDPMLASNYYAGGSTVSFWGEIPANKYATLTAGATIGDGSVTVDDGSKLTTGDTFYLSKVAIRNYNSNCTLHTVTGVVGNVVSFTPNVAGNNREIGGFLLKTSGYGINFFCDELTGSRYAEWRLNVTSTLACSGVRFQGQYMRVGYSVTYYLDDDAANVRPGCCSYVHDCVVEGYQATQYTATGFFTLSVPTKGTGAEFDDNISISSMIMGFYFLGPGTNLYQRRNIAYRSYNWLNYSGLSKLKYICEDNILHNAAALLGIRGVKSVFKNNVLYGGLYGYRLSTFAFDISANDFTGNSVEMVEYTHYTITGDAPAIINCEERDNIYTNIGTGGLDMNSEGLVQHLIQSPTGDMSTVNTANLALYSTPGSYVAIVDNNNAPTEDYLFLTYGSMIRCGTGLADTTVYGTNSYSWRFRPSSSTNALAWDYDALIGDQNGYSMFAYMWIKINAAAYYAGTHQLPRLTVTYDQSSTAYAQAAQSTAWQQLIVPLTLASTYPSINIELSGYTDATLTDADFYLGQIGVVLPAGRNVDPGALDFWANAKPLTGLPTSLSAFDVWAVPTSQLTGAGTVGAWVATKLLSVAKFIGLK